MKIKNLKYTFGMLTLSTTLTFTGCSSSHHVEEVEIAMEFVQDESEIEILENEITTESVKEQQVIEETFEQEKEKASLTRQEKENLFAKLKENLGSSFEYTGHGSQYSIRIENISDDLELSDTFYADFNTILSDSASYSLELNSLGDDIDFSKLDLTNIRSLSFTSCYDNFDYDAFSNYTYDNLSFYNISFESIEKIVKNSTTCSTFMDYANYNHLDDGYQLIEFLVENDISVGKLDVVGDDNNSHNIYELLSQVNGEEINFYEQEITPNLEKSKLDLNLRLNDRIQSITFSLSTKELGDIYLSSSNPDLFFYFIDVNLTENTNFYLPDQIYFNLFGNYTDLSAFRNLNNVTYFSYFDYDTYAKVEYLKNKTDFDIFLEEIETLHGKSLVK